MGKMEILGIYDCHKAVLNTFLSSVMGSQTGGKATAGGHT